MGVTVFPTVSGFLLQENHYDERELNDRSWREVYRLEGFVREINEISKSIFSKPNFEIKASGKKVRRQRSQKEYNIQIFA